MAGFAIVSPHYYVTSKRSFNDLVWDRILFESESDAKRILEEMFPSQTVTVNFSRSGGGFITVGDVAMRVWSY